MAKTRAQLVNRVLGKLKIIGVGQTASAGVSQAVNVVIDPVMSSLGERSIFQWGDPNDLPESAFEHLADCVAYAAAGDFGKAYDPTPNHPVPVPERFERRLRELNPYQLSNQPQTTEYF